MFNIKYLTMHKVHMHAGAIGQLLYGCAYVRKIILSLKFMDYLPVQKHNHTIPLKMMSCPCELYKL